VPLVSALWDFRNRLMPGIQGLYAPRAFNHQSAMEQLTRLLSGQSRQKSWCCRTHVHHYVRECLRISNICLRKKQGSHARRSRLANPNFHELSHEVIPAGIGAIDAHETMHVFCYVVILKRLLIESCLPRVLHVLVQHTRFPPQQSFNSVPTSPLSN
jgi:hypothetical protein